MAATGLRKGAAATRLSGARLCLLLGWASVLVLPWYGIEGGLVRALTEGGAPAVVEAARASPWLFGLLLPLLLASLAELRRQPRLLAWAGAAGIAWALLQGFAIDRQGWAIVDLGSLSGWAAAQPALGWGALGYLIAMALLAAHGLARQGWCKGDAFTVGALVVVCGSILIFVGYPVLCVLLSAFKDNAGAGRPADVRRQADRFLDLGPGLPVRRAQLRRGLELAGPGHAGRRAQHAAGPRLRAGGRSAPASRSRACSR